MPQVNLIPAVGPPYGHTWFFDYCFKDVLVEKDFQKDLGY